MNYPLLLEPVYKDYLWGGRRIPTRLGRDLPAGVYAESWEVTDRPEGISVVTNGPLKGRTLRDLMRESARELAGGDARGLVFPLLVKIIDAEQRLSVQVHPADSNAADVGGEAKTEAWYILWAGRGSRVYAGFREGVDPATFASALAEKRIGDILQPFPVKAGDAVFIPGGVVHAIDANCFLLEVQQNSNTTYRLYDWDRLGSDGKPRRLDVDRALRSLVWSERPQFIPRAEPSVKEGRNDAQPIVECPHFGLRRLVLREPLCVGHGGRGFHVYFVAAGRVVIRGGAVETEVRQGTTVLVPAALTEFRVEPQEGSAELLQMTPGQRAPPASPAAPS